MTPIARIRRGYARMWAWVKGRWAKLTARIQRRPESTPGQIDQERETAVSLGLMAEAAAAGGEMSDEQAIFLSAAKTGMRNRVAVLMGIPHRSLAQERELVMIERELARVEGRDEPAAAPAIRSFMPARPGFLAGLMPMLPYIAAAGLFLSVTGWGGTLINGWRADRFEAQRDRARAIAEHNHEAALRWRERAEHYRQAVSDAAAVARQAATQLEAERAARARQAERERRRIRELQNVLTGSAEPPAWRLRDDEPAADSSTGAARP